MCPKGFFEEEVYFKELKTISLCLKINVIISLFCYYYFFYFEEYPQYISAV